MIPLTPEAARVCATLRFRWDHFWSTYPTFYEPFPGQEAKIVGLGLAPLMDAILISDREGVRKPDAVIFHRALERLNVSPDTAWFVGDHPDADVQGANEAGLTAVLRRSWVEHAPHAAHVISSLDELIPLIEGATASA